MPSSFQGGGQLANDGRARTWGRRPSDTREAAASRQVTQRGGPFCVHRLGISRGIVKGTAECFMYTFRSDAAFALCCVPRYMHISLFCGQKHSIGHSLHNARLQHIPATRTPNQHSNSHTQSHPTDLPPSTPSDPHTHIPAPSHPPLRPRARQQQRSRPHQPPRTGTH